MSKPPVVIVRKDKRLRKGFHLLAFALTGGASGVVTAAKAGTNAGYNARTRALQAAAEAPEAPAAPPQRRGRRQPKIKWTPEEIAYMKAHTPRQKP